MVDYRFPGWFPGWFPEWFLARTAKNLCITGLEISDTASVIPTNFQYPFLLHPSTLHSIFHLLFAALSAESELLQDPIVPVFIGEIYISQSINNEAGHPLIVYASTDRKDFRQVNSSILVVDKARGVSQPVIQIDGLGLMTLANDTLEESSTNAKKK